MFMNDYGLENTTLRKYSLSDCPLHVMTGRKTHNVKVVGFGFMQELY